MQPHLSRRAALATISATAGAVLAGRPALAQDRFLDIRPGNAFRPVTVAVTNFGGDAEQGAKLSSVVTNDFKRCSFIQPRASPSRRPTRISRTWRSGNPRRRSSC